MDFVEQILQRAADRGEFDAAEGARQPSRIDDAEPGWWARREAARIRAEVQASAAISEVERRLGRVWALASETAVRRRVAELNRLLAEAGAGDAQLDADETVATWRRMARLRIGRRT